MADVCKDCQQPTRSWWTSSYKSGSGPHSARCHACYLAYTRAKQNARGHGRRHPQSSVSRDGWECAVPDVIGEGGIPLPAVDIVADADSCSPRAAGFVNLGGVS
jgi:hypothetical protein